jgi:hypothetical protein
MKEILNTEPVALTLLPGGAFSEYTRLKVENGAELAHLKPAHMKPSKDILMKLINTTNETK